MKLYANKLTVQDVDEGVATKEEGTVLRVHSFCDAPGILKTSAGLADGDIARELHDNVAQQLTSLSLLLGKLGKKLIGRSVSRAGDVYRIEENLLRITEDVHRLSRRVKPSTITAAGFNNAIRALAESVRHSAGLNTILMLAEELLPDDATAEHLYRIAQEAVHNVLRHAKASSLGVIFKVEGNSFLLVVRDDGNGISAAAGAPRGEGIKSMKSRAGTIGAQLEVRSVPGRGTAVRCVLPFHER